MDHIPRTAEEIAADRARYEEHQRNGLNFAPRALPPASAVPAPEPDSSRVIHRETIPGGWYWTTPLSRGEVLRLSPDSATTTLALAAWSAADRTERMNLPDTVKLQWTTGLTKGRVIFSDMGRVMLSIVEDSSGAHDVLTGGSSPATMDDINARNTRDNMVLAAAKLGLDRRDLPALLSFFAPLRLDGEGKFEWRPDLLSGGDWVELRAEMDVVLALSNCPHPLDPDPARAIPAMVATRLAAQPPAEDDLCRTATAEAVRGFENNARM